MTGFAAGHGTILAVLLHSYFELSVVRIQMATRTGQFIPVVRNLPRFQAITLFVAVAARNSHVATSQNEPGRFVAR
jgi:hypothetical protein